MLEIKNKDGIYEPVAVGKFKEVLPMAFGNVSRFICLGAEKELSNDKSAN